MKKMYNFSGGPSKLFEQVIENSIKSIKNFENTGIGILEISHRDKAFSKMIEDLVNLTKEILEIPSGYSVFFMSGGASNHFGLIPMNFLKKKGYYIETGYWSQKAIEEGKVFGNIEILSSSMDKNFSYIPKNILEKTDGDYIHLTANNTIYGTEFKYDPEFETDLIADMSSNIFSKKIDVSKYSMIYAGSQKNLGSAGSVMIIMKDSFASKINLGLPKIFDYRTHIKENSLYNTPSVFSIYTIYETLKYIKSIGLQKIEEINNEKAKIIYEAVDNSLFFEGICEKEDRSNMNICFRTKKGFEEKEKEFLELSKQNNIYGIKGHRKIGGFRVSIYNAVSLEEVKFFSNLLSNFNKKN